MKNIFEILEKSALFTDISETDIEILIKCLSVEERHFNKNDFIFKAGEKITVIGIVLSGGVNIIQEDFWGNRNILAHIGEGQLFGEAFSCAETEKLPVSVVTSDKTDIMLIDNRKIIETCSSSCVFHTKLIKNIIRILAEKNIMLTRKIEHITSRTTREKILSYLSAQAKLTGSSEFSIPFDRQGLADYLAVDRSAMSNELSKLRSEKVLEFNKNYFKL